MYISQIPNVCILTFDPLHVFDENTFIVKITVNDYIVNAAKCRIC